MDSNLIPINKLVYAIDHNFDFTRMITYEYLESIIHNYKVIDPNNIFPEFSFMLFGNSVIEGYLDSNSIGKVRLVNKAWNNKIMQLTPYKTVMFKIIDKFDPTKWESFLEGVSIDNNIKAIKMTCGVLHGYDYKHMYRIEYRYLSLSYISELIKLINKKSNIKSLSLKMLECDDLSILRDLKIITKLTLSGCEKITNTNGITHLTSLTSLDLSYCGKLTNIDALTNLISLTILDLSYCENLISIDVLANLTNLIKLNLSGCKNIKNIDVLANWKKLKIIK